MSQVCYASGPFLSGEMHFAYFVCCCLLYLLMPIYVLSVANILFSILRGRIEGSRLLAHGGAWKSAVGVPEL